MTVTHIALTLFLGFCFIAFVFLIISKGILHVRYAVLWLCIGVMILFAPLFYEFGLLLQEKFSFPTPSASLFMGAALLLALISLQLCVSASRARRERKNLAQRLAMLEYALQRESMKEERM